MRNKAILKNSLVVRLLIAYLTPTLFFLALFGLLAHRVAKTNLENSLGHQLTSIAQTAAIQVRSEAIRFLSPGDDESRTAVRIKHKLERIRKRVGARRVFILDQNLRSRMDTDPTIRIGDPYYQVKADRHELDKVFAGEVASSVLFKGIDGRFYKTGYAPISQDNKVIAAFGVEGSAKFFGALGRLRTYLLLTGFITSVLIVLVSLFLAR
ncbi:MAG: two-component sensor histidine kinase, partial [Pseudomonadota bacterium]